MTANEIQRLVLAPLQADRYPPGVRAQLQALVAESPGAEFEAACRAVGCEWPGAVDADVLAAFHARTPAAMLAVFVAARIGAQVAEKPKAKDLLAWLDALCADLARSAEQM